MTDLEFDDEIPEDLKYLLKPEPVKLDLDSALDELTIEPDSEQKYSSAIESARAMRDRLNPNKERVKRMVLPADDLAMRRRDVENHVMTDKTEITKLVKSMGVGHYFLVNKELEIFVRNLTYRQKQKEEVQFSVTAIRYAKVKYFKVTRLKNKPNSLRIIIDD